MSCIIKIRSIRDEMSANEKKLADYILSNAALLRDYSSQQLASAVGVSQSSVVKFCQKLGYRGYPDLKWAINESIAKDSTKDNNRPQYFSNTELNTVSEQLLQGKLEAVTATIELNDGASFFKASNAIKKANKIQIIGSGVASFTAEYFATSLVYTSKVAYTSNDPIYQSQFLKSLSKNDVLILLSATNELAMKKVMLSDIRNQGVQIIRICPYSPNTNYNVSDISLSTISDTEGSANNAQIASRAAQQHIIDILLSLTETTIPSE